MQQNHTNAEIEAVKKARALLQDVTPLKTDCGKLCAHACCQADDTGKGGMLLFKGEESLYQNQPDFHIYKNMDVTEKGLLLVCNGTCTRSNRPLSCMLFPLLPKEIEGKIKVVKDVRGYIVCPLLQHPLSAFSQTFKDKVKEAGEMLYKVQAHRDFLNALHAFNHDLQSF